MKVTREKTENSQTYLTIEMDQAALEESIEKAYRRLVQKNRVPGFRPGKTPRAVFERYFGRQRLLEEAYEQLVPEAYDRAVKEQEIEAIARPQIEITQAEPLVFKAIVPLKPTIKLGEYRQVRIPEEAPRDIAGKDVDDVIEALRHQQATWEPADREVLPGDLVALDIWSEVEDKPFINQKSGQYQPKTGADFPVPGFAEQIIGMKRDEEKEFVLKFADDDARTEYAGKEAKFKIRLNEVKQEILPELNDDFAKAASAANPTVESLRDKIAANLKARAEEDTRSAFQDKTIETVSEQSQVEFPEILVVNEIHNLIDQRFRTREQLEAYMKAVNKTEEELHQELHDELQPLALKRVKRGLVLGKIAEEEKIEVSPAEIDAETERMLASLGSDREKLQKTLNTPEVRESVADRLLTSKTIERLIEIVRGQSEATTEKEDAK